jgi:hypothetical protein
MPSSQQIDTWPGDRLIPPVEKGSVSDPHVHPVTGRPPRWGCSGPSLRTARRRWRQTVGSGRCVAALTEDEVASWSCLVFFPKGQRPLAMALAVGALVCVW